MFTGIVEAMGEIRRIEQEGTNRHFCVASPISLELKVDQSLSHQGVCLTVTRLEDGLHWVTAIEETLTKSNLGTLSRGDWVNLERSMPANGRFDGHVVQGHVDQTARCISIQEGQGSWLMSFRYDPTLNNLTVEKGSIAVNGISLTCFNCTESGFTVAIIPYTYEHTSMKYLREGDVVNLEFDILGKYIQRILAKR
jgi:riboflavin synthase